MISVIEIEDVLLAKMADGLTMGSMEANIFRFSSRFSMTASTTKSQSARSCLRVVPFNREKIASADSVMAPFAASLSRDFRMAAKPFSIYFSIDFQDGHIEPGRGGHLSDSGTHQAATEHANFFEFPSRQTSFRVSFLQDKRNHHSSKPTMAFTRTNLPCLGCISRRNALQGSTLQS